MCRLGGPKIESRTGGGAYYKESRHLCRAHKYLEITVSNEYIMKYT